MIYYAVRQKGTMLYLPTQRDRPATWLTLTSPLDAPPRLFTRRCYAQQAANRWLKGRSELSPEGDEVVVPVKERADVELEVVEVGVEL